MILAPDRERIRTGGAGTGARIVELGSPAHHLQLIVPGCSARNLLRTLVPARYHPSTCTHPSLGSIRRFFARCHGRDGEIDWSAGRVCAIGQRGLLRQFGPSRRQRRQNHSGCVVVCDLRLLVSIVPVALLHSISLVSDPAVVGSPTRTVAHPGGAVRWRSRSNFTSVPPIPMTPGRTHAGSRSRSKRAPQRERELRPRVLYASDIQQCHDA